MTPRSHFNDPISTDRARSGGFSREAGDASDEVKQKVIDAIVARSRGHGLSAADAANLLAIAKVESKFNPDAAARGSHTSASGVFQITDSTARDARERLSGKPRINGHQLGSFDRFDLNSNIEYGVAIYMDKKAIAQSGDVADIYRAWNSNPAEYANYLGQLRRDSSKYLAEIESTGGLKLDSTGLSAPTITSPKHPGHAYYRQALAGVEKYNAAHNVQSSNESNQNAAAALAVEARVRGMTQIDHVDRSDDGTTFIIVQGRPGSAHSKAATLGVQQALEMPLAQSSQAYDEAQRLQANRNSAQGHWQQQAAPAPSR